MAREIPVQRDPRTDLAELSLEALEALLTARGLPRFRARQIFRWIWRRGATSFEGDERPVAPVAHVAG